MSSVLKQLGIENLPEHFATKSADSWERMKSAADNRLARHGDFPRHLEQIEALPSGQGSNPNLSGAAPRLSLTALTTAQLLPIFRALGPWKKGPFSFETSTGELRIDAEWRSDLKWSRVLELGVDFSGRHVVDVGTGNGYFLYRLLGAGARSVLGVEPGVLSVAQFLALNRLFGESRCSLAPVTSSEFIQGCRAFDVALSMGVLYHRRSPLDHLVELRGFLRPGGTLVLETLAYPGPLGFSFLPQGRYAQMRNVFFLPSPDTLESWLRKVGFSKVRRSALLPTSVDEQRTTPWMPHPSLEDFLAPTEGDPDEPTRRTVEGHVRPHRIILLAEAPRD